MTSFNPMPGAKCLSNKYRRNKENKGDASFLRPLLEMSVVRARILNGSFGRDENLFGMDPGKH